MGASALSERLNIPKANDVDLFHALSSACFSKASANWLGSAGAEQPCREGASAWERLQRKGIPDMFFCSSELSKHIFNHILLQLALNKAAALMYFLFIFL